MIDNFLIVSQQVFILFILIALGFICGKTKLLNEMGAKQLTNAVLYLATPCVIIKSFQSVEFNRNLSMGLLITAICATAIQVSSIFICKAVFRNKNESRRKVLQFSTVFSNCGFMSLPLQQALIGDKGVFYGSVFVAIFNILVWSYGLVDMSGNKKDFNIKKIILNPGVLGVGFALVFFFAQIKLPTVIASPINYLASLNTPLPMLIIGYHLSQADILKAFKDKATYFVIALRLLIIPAVSLLVMYFLGVSGDILIACTVASSAPTAATTTMFATKFNRDVELSVNLVSCTTLLSIITMPFIIAFSQMIS